MKRGNLERCIVKEEMVKVTQGLPNFKMIENVLRVKQVSRKIEDEF